MKEAEQSIWAVSDGRIGLSNQVLGLAESVARRSPRPIDIKTFEIDRPWRGLPLPLLAGPLFGLPHSAARAGTSPIPPPWPRIFIGCGRAAIALSLAINRWSGGNVFRVQTQDPRCSPAAFDLVIPPRHDRLGGANVFSIIGSPNRVTPDLLSRAASQFSERFAALPHPRVAALIGGAAKGHTLTIENIDQLADALRKLCDQGAGLMITVSRRTGDDNTARLRTLLDRPGIDIWDGHGDNPYFAMLALADFILVTEDSTNMATEAAATGKPIYILPLAGARAKQSRLHAELSERGIARAFTGTLAPFTYEPLRETDRAAQEICRRAGIQNAP